MPPAYLLNTNIVSYSVRGDYPAARRRILNTPLELLAVSAVTEAELRFWVISRPTSSRIRLGVEDFLARVPSLAWDSGAAQFYAATRESLKRRGLVLSTEDLMIAAQALSLGLTMVTHDNVFSLVDGLNTEDWTVAAS
jgi:tRNA(fMet)-specific endonuclease VapC